MALPKDVKFRLLDTMDWPGAAGQTRKSLPITEVYQSMNLLVAGQLDIAVKDSTAVQPEGMLSLIRGVTLEAVSSQRRNLGKIKYADFAALYVLQKFLRNTSGLIANPGDAKIQAATPISVDLQLDFEFPHSESPRQTLLKATELTALNMILDWGAEGDLIEVAGGSTVTLSKLSCAISGREITDPDAKAPKYGVNIFNYIEQTISGANARLLVDIKRGNLLRGFLIKQFTRAAGVYPHTPVNTIINSVKLELNRDVKMDFDSWTRLQGQNVYDYRMPAAITGYAFIDLMEDGRFDKIINTSIYRDVNAVFDVNAIANGVIRVYPVEMLPSNA